MESINYETTFFLKGGLSPLAGAGTGLTGLSLLVDQMRGSKFRAMQIIANGDRQTTSSLPQTLRKFDRIPESEPSRTRLFSMETMGGGRRGMGMMRQFEVVG